jgi:hypothetical protein
MPLAHHTAKNQRGSGPPRLRPSPTQWEAAAAQLLIARRCACGTSSQRAHLWSSCGGWAAGTAAVAARPGPALPLGQVGLR